MYKKKVLRYLGILAIFCSATFLAYQLEVRRPAFAATPGQYGLTEGDLISAIGSNDPDIYIINDWGYKRLFLNPVIFNFYGHLSGGWAAVKHVSQATRDAFPTSGLFRNCETNDQAVWGLEVTGEDTGVLHHVALTGAQAAT